MAYLSKQHQFLERLINGHTTSVLDAAQTKILYQNLVHYLKAPEASEYTLELIAIRIVKMGVDYEAYVSALIFKMLPNEFTKGELVQIEDEFYQYIEKELYGKGLDKKITEKLIEYIIKQNPKLEPSLAEKKAMGNWGWLLPHALTQLVIDAIMELLEQAKIEANKGKKKGRVIRIKKM